MIKEQFCTDTVKLVTHRTETSTVTPLLCPFECAVVFKTQTDQRQHLMKEYSCTDKKKNDFFDEREAEEKNNILIKPTRFDTLQVQKAAERK